ncbi:uncharacterized protein LOC143934630 isoform X4 [Lithobates pipiens]
MKNRTSPVTAALLTVRYLQKCPGGGRSQPRAPPTTTPNRRSLRMRVTLTWNQPIPTKMCPSPTFAIPASPFMQKFAYGTRVSVYLMKRGILHG